MLILLLVPCFLSAVLLALEQTAQQTEKSCLLPALFCYKMSCLFFPSSPWVPMLSVGYLVCLICQCILQISLKRTLSWQISHISVLGGRLGQLLLIAAAMYCPQHSPGFVFSAASWLGGADKSPPERLIPGVLTSKHLPHSNAFISRENNFPGTVGQLVETPEEEVGPRDLSCFSHIAPSKPFTIF